MDVKALQDEIQEIHDSGDCGKALSGILDMANRLCDQPSDLEIVQKALEKTDQYLDLMGDGRWYICDRYTSSSGPSGEGNESLLTWAKQTIGE